MPFDPNFPPDHQDLDGQPFRDQFNGLNDNINAKPSMADVTNAISSTAARNCDAVQPSNIAFHDPISRAEGEALQDKYNELLAALHS